MANYDPSLTPVQVQWLESQAGRGSAPVDPAAAMRGILGPGGAFDPAPKPPAVFPSPVPTFNIANPVITPANLGQPGSSPVAQGFDLFQVMLDNILKAEQLRQSAVDQQVNIANLFAQLEKASPSQAANLAVRLGIPGLEPDLSYANAFAGPGSTGVFGGKVGSQNITLPFAFSGKELSFLGNNPAVASGISDIAAALGRPDALRNSMSSLIPTSSSLFSF